MKPAIRLEHVSKEYRLGAGQTSLREVLANSARGLLKSGAETSRENDIFWALRDVSLELPRGRSLGLIGPNGAGKTTILKLLSKITSPTSGTVEVSGRVSSLIELGAGFHPDLSGRENIYLNAAILGLPRKEVNHRFDRIVAFSGLEQFIDTPVKRYSSGMYVRLGFSVAAHVEPDLLLVDEVLAVGDSQFRQRCAQRIAELQDHGTTIVLVSHNLWLMQGICDSAVFLAKGQIQAQGDVVTTINEYESWLHEQQIHNSFLGDAPENSVLTGSSGVNITRVEVQSLNSNGTNQLHYKDALEVRVYFDAKEPIPGPFLSVHIVRADGTTACLVRTSDYGFAFDALDGKGVISLGLDPLQLAGGSYIVDAYLNGDTDGVSLARGYSSWFQVTGLSLSYDERCGVFVPNVAWAKVEPGN